MAINRDITAPVAAFHDLHPSVTDEQLAAIIERAGTIHKTRDGGLPSLAGIPDSVRGVLLEQALRELDAEAAAADAPKKFTDQELAASAIIQEIAAAPTLKGWGKLLDHHIGTGLSRPLAVAKCEAEALTLGMRFGSLHPATVKLPKEIRRALKAAGIEKPITAASTAPSSKPNKNKNNPYSLDATDPTRQTKIIALVRSSTALANSFAKQAGCTISGEPLRR